MKRGGIGVAAVVGVLVAVTFTASAPPASAWVSGSLWDPGYIISDAQFFDEDAMSESQIQSFLEAKVPTCHPEWDDNPDDVVCMKDFRQTTTTRPADAYCPNTYVGAANELASTIIYKVAQACGISPKVLLITLQKEQGLVTHVWPSSYRYDKAMGYACPDTAPCDAEYFGFQTQVWRAARQFQRYTLLPNNYGHRAGVENIIQYKPNSTCGTQAVFIQNAATAALYNYTPYVPNQAALNNMGTTGDNCSSYGNRNFWMYYWEWFGDPHATGALLGVTSSSRIAGADRYATGAALSATFAAPAAVVYIASGENYPDALAVAPVAAIDGAALLLVQRDAIPASIAAELTRLRPARIVVVGGTAAISDTVVSQLAAYAGAGGVSRVTGLDRYETARATVRSHWAPGSAPLVYVTSGRDFPDALSAAAAAGSQGAPVVILNGAEARLDAETAALIAELGATTIVIAGGTAAVSQGIQDDLDAIVSVTTISRLSGADRYSTSAAINAYAFPTATRVYVASGAQFPDALAGAVRAGIDRAPLYVVPGSCVPSTVADAINAFGPVTVTLLGGTTALPLNVSTAPAC